MSMLSHMGLGRCFIWILAIGLILTFISPVRAAQVTLAWDANDPTPDGYHLYQRMEGDAYDYASPVWSGTGTICSLDNLADSTMYYFVVRAYSGGDESGDSNEVSYLTTGTVEPQTHTITASAGTSGEISPAGQTTVTAGERQTYTISASAGYHVADVTVDGVSVGTVSTYTFSAVDADHTISASFAPNTYSITASSDGNGMVSPSGSTLVLYGGSQSYSITPSTGYRVSDVVVDGTSVGAVSNYTFIAVSGSHTISASFAPNTYSITASSDGNGTVSPSGSTLVLYGDSQTYSITPSAGYRVSDVVVDDTSVGAVSNYTFIAVSGSHTISASFAPNTYSITASSDGNGTVSPSGSTLVLYGDSQAYSITPSAGYQVNDVMVDGACVGAVDSYTFDQVSSNHIISVFFSAINQPPVADAGPDQTVDEAEEVTLSALNAMDPDDGIAAFSWRQIQGPAVMLSDPTGAETTFTAPDVDMAGEALVFELLVTDNSGATAVDSCIVNVSWVNEAPTAQAGADQSVMEGELVVLDAGSSVDPDNGIASYQWRQIQGPAVTLSDSTAVGPAFTAPAVDGQGASILFELTVTDSGGLQDTDQCIVTVSWSNEPPVADAGPDQQVAEGQAVYLNGANSMDPDDGIAAYQWRQTDGPPVALSDATAIQPMFYAPDVISEAVALTFQLTVTDNGGLQSQDECIVNVTWQNMPPVADAGGDLEAFSGDEVSLDGTASWDGDDGISSYRWKQISGTAVTLQNAYAAATTFTAPDVASGSTTLTFELTVTDTGGLQHVDRCSVAVHANPASAPDTTPPSIAITDPDAGFIFVGQSQITLRGTASDDSDIVRVVWVNDRGGSGQATGTAAWQIENITLSRWFNTITVTAYDAAGNYQSTTLTVLAFIW